MMTKAKSNMIPKHMTGRECLASAVHAIKFPKMPRLVPAFTFESLQRETIVIPPKRLNVFAKHPPKDTLFRIYFKRGDLPIVAMGRQVGRKKGKLPVYPVRWFCQPADLDYCYYLPIFIDGLADTHDDLRFLAYYGALDLIQHAPQKVLPTLPKLILPLKRAFNTRNKKVIISALQVMQAMVTQGPCVGHALVPYYRQLLAVCNLYRNINVNLGDGVDVDRGRRIGDVIEDTLRILEACGGPNAYINIKYMVPTYESSQLPKCENKAGTAKASKVPQPTK